MNNILQKIKSIVASIWSQIKTWLNIIYPPHSNKNIELLNRLEKHKTKIKLRNTKVVKKIKKQTRKK